MDYNCKTAFNNVVESVTTSTTFSCCKNRQCGIEDEFITETDVQIPTYCSSCKC